MMRLGSPVIFRFHQLDQHFILDEKCPILELEKMKHLGLVISSAADVSMAFNDGFLKHGDSRI